MVDKPGTKTGGGKRPSTATKNKAIGGVNKSKAGGGVKSETTGTGSTGPKSPSRKK